ncbi:MAG: ATP-dependent Clp protease proteolytic subunit [Bulleidia sp.]|nr:ATP-dependent Clp protease proteolytic subunit [Bulleidia sp.]
MMENTCTRLGDTRIIYINGQIDDNMAFIFNTLLLRMEQESREEISVYINSPGGSITAGYSMIDTMNLIRPDVSTICVGAAYSMAALLLMSGTKGKRRILPHSTVLIHQSSMSMPDNLMKASDVEHMAREGLRTRQSIYQTIHECTGQPPEQIAVDCEKESVMNAQETLNYHIVDEIVSSHKKKVHSDG